MKTLRILFLVASAMLFGLCVSCGDDDPVAPTPDPDNGEPAFVYTEVWQYVSDEDDDGNHDTVVMYCNMDDSTFHSRVFRHSTLPKPRFVDYKYGSFQVRTLTFGEEEEEQEDTPTLFLYENGALEPQYYIISFFDGENIMLSYFGADYYVYPPIWTNEYDFNKIQ